LPLDDDDEEVGEEADMLTTRDGESEPNGFCGENRADNKRWGE
jgi:hypothetical protein